MMRSFAVSILLLTCILTGCWKEPKKFDWKNAPGAEQYERLLWQAIHEKNWNDVEHHLASTFVGVSAGGQKFDRGGWVEYWKGLQITDFSMGELTVEPNGPDMAVTYDLHLTGATGASIPNGGVRIVSVWQQVKNGWVLTAESATPIR